MNDLRRKTLRFVAVLVAVVALLAILIYIVSYLLFPINDVRVEGNRMFPKKEVIRNIPNHTSLLTLNPWSLKRNLKSNPWVKGVSVTRDWGSGIVTVEVEEHHAVLSADLGKKKVILAQDGTELPGLGGAKLKTLKLDGSRLEEIVKAGKVLQRNGIEMETVDAVGPGGVYATIRGREVVFAGEPGLNQVRALGGVMRENPSAKVFDLRSPERVVVGAPAGTSGVAPDGSPGNTPNG